MLEPAIANTVYGKRTFDYAGARLWNALPVDLRVQEDIECFKNGVKTILFRDFEGFKRKTFIMID